MTNYQTREDSRRIVLAALAQSLSRTDVGSTFERATWDVYQCEAKRHEQEHGEYYGGVSFDTWRRCADNSPAS